MIKSIEMTGRTEDDAIAAALRELNKTREDVSVEILERAKSGFFGFGSSPAKIRVSYEEPDPPTPKAEAPAGAASGPEAQRVTEFLDGLFQRMGVAAHVDASYSAEDNTVSVELSGEKVGALIGRRGETLDAIQHLANYVLNSGSEDRTRVNIDAENYRAKRADALSGLAKKTAAKVVRYRRNMTLEPMNAYERHVIHTALQDFAGVTTYSTGTEPNRRVVVAYDAATAPRDRWEDSSDRTSSERSDRYDRSGDRRNDRRNDRGGGRPPRRQSSSGYGRGGYGSAATPAAEKPPVDKTVREWN